MSTWRNRQARLWGSKLALPIALSSLLLSARASAANPVLVTGWAPSGKTEPSDVSMYEYVPAKVATNPPILVLVHYCGGNASGVFGEAQGGGIVAAADKYGFIMVVPQTSRNCWDIATTAALTHGGNSDTGAIVDQVKYAITKHNANADRVYVTGTSSGAMMTEGLLAVYPEVFKGGSEFAGVPAGCWSVNDPDGEWSGPCAGGTVTHTAAEWGTMVKAMYPGYTGPRPRVQLWHGDADATIKFQNQTEAIKEWTNVLGLSTTATTTATVTIGTHQYKREQWQNSCGVVVLDALSEVNGPHGTDANFNADYVIPFLGLDQAGAVDPAVAKCGGTGGMGSGGATGSAGSSASGGAPGSGGSPASGGAPAAGGTVGSAGAIGSAGSVSSLGGSGGANTGVGGSSGSPVGPSAGSPPSTDPGPTDAGPPRPGCSCELARTSGPSGALAWAGVLGLSLLLGRRRRDNRVRDAR